MRFLAILFLSSTPAVAIADSCAPGVDLVFPGYEAIEPLGLNVVVAAREHPALADRAEMTVSERVAAFEVFFEDEYGHEPAGAQDVRRLGAFVLQFNLASRGGPSMSSVFSEPEYVPAVLPVLERLGVENGVAALKDVQNAFWFFGDMRSEHLLSQLAFNSVIGATIDDAREMAPELLAEAGHEINDVLAVLEAEDPSVAALMTVMWERVDDWDRRNFIEDRIEWCLEWDYEADHGPPLNWDDIPQPQKDLLVLMEMEHRFDYMPDFFASHGWMLDDALRVTQELGLEYHYAALQDGLALLSPVLPREGPEWENSVWDVAGDLEEAAHGNLYDQLRAEQGDEYEVSYDVPLWDAFERLAKQHPIWP